jgi:hypothetical protein
LCHTSFRVKRKKLIVAFLLGALAIAVVVIMILAPRLRGEPSYHGHPLSYWVESFGGPRHDHPVSRDIEALSAIGTNALPYLLNWIRCDLQPSRGRHAATVILKHVPIALRPAFLVNWANESAYLQHQAQLAAPAAEVFFVLGTNAEPSIPALRTIAASSNNRFASTVAVVALLQLGTNGFAAVIEVIASTTNRDAILQTFPLRDRVAPEYREVISGPPTATVASWEPTENTDSRINSARAAPLLLHCLEDPDQSIRDQAARLLCAANPEIVVPALTNFLSLPRTVPVRQQANWIVAAHGPQASPAIPFFLPRLQDPDPQIRLEATNVLSMVAPERLGRDF